MILQQLEQDHLSELKACKDMQESERCKLMDAAQIRHVAYQIEKGRKLTSIELAIAQKYSYKSQRKE